MQDQFLTQLESSRSKLLGTIPENVDVTFIRLFGNVGDDLIYAGIRQLLRPISYREISVRQVSNSSGSFAVVAGGGSWCRAFHLMPEYLKAIEERFQSVVIFPSSFDVSVEAVEQSLRNTKAKVFAREFVLCLDEAVAAIEAVEADYTRHQVRAREIAAAYFDARVVLRQMLKDVNID